MRIWYMVWNGFLVIVNLTSLRFHNRDLQPALIAVTIAYIVWITIDSIIGGLD